MFGVFFCFEYLNNLPTVLLFVMMNERSRVAKKFSIFILDE